MSDEDTFTCAVCEGTFAKAWTDEEAKAEAKARFGDIPADAVLVCGTCMAVIEGRN